MNKTMIINGITVVDITPELPEEEEQKRIDEFAEALLTYAKKRKKQKENTA